MKKDGRGGAREGAGRPIKTKNKRDKNLNIRLSQNELNLIGECSEKLNTTRTNTIVKAIEDLHQKLK